ncbi:Murein DD-endopeptidase MepM [Streptomyces sp. YIM 130001]|uniref:M23 family metallopeptidase n=1 Tax=Streptomyces sp. YIM 130001 TaxID=2259644 RepID=UPI000E654869|nr:M23 family metallopeptidase [Streptomyces sp. YIM 130001]RII12487.1 Murein DD-endopeptidase MepM [Streptomyces sp. YIM 130001]
MSLRTTTHRSGSSVLRTRAAVLAAGLGVSTLLGAGVSVAAAGDAPQAGQASTVASIEAQAAAQGKKAAAKAKAQSDAKQAAAKKANGWSQPVAKYTLSSTFGKGGSMWASKHSGQDFAVPVGTQVKAAHAGTVVKAGGNGAGDGPAYGNAIVVKHADGKFSQYAHLSRIDVKAGQKVANGQNIARSGNTGNSSGPHLHFEIRNTANYGSAIDPAAFLRGVGVKI